MSDETDCLQTEEPSIELANDLRAPKEDTGSLELADKRENNEE